MLSWLIQEMNFEEFFNDAERVLMEIGFMKHVESLILDIRQSDK